MNENPQKLLALIYEFRKAFFQPIATSWAECDKDQCKLYARLIAEEAAEYNAAKSRVDILDALGDLTYVIFGAAASCGLTPMKCKARFPSPSPGFKPRLNESVVKLIAALLEDNLCYNKLGQYLTESYWLAEQIAGMLGVDLVLLMEEIHHSNMSKRWTAHELEEVPENSTVTQSTDGTYVVKNANGKVIKSPSHCKPELTTF